MKDHLAGDYVTNGIDVHSSIFRAARAWCTASAKPRNVVLPPKYDDLMMVNRYGWRGFLKFQQFRPEYLEIVESAGSTD